MDLLKKVSKFSTISKPFTTFFKPFHYSFLDLSGFHTLHPPTRNLPALSRSLGRVAKTDGV
jgi:hypothetical protein